MMNNDDLMKMDNLRMYILFTCNGAMIIMVFTIFFLLLYYSLAIVVTRDGTGPVTGRPLRTYRQKFAKIH